MSVSVVEVVSNPVNPEHFEYDIAAVGSSPISVVNAMLERFQDKTVIVLEARDVVGGAWAGDTVCGLNGVDIGSHDISIKEESAKFLEKFFGVKCIEIGSDQYLPEGGCAKMSQRLVEIAKNAGITFKTNCRVEKATLLDQGVVLDCVASGQSLKVTAGKVIKPTYTAFDVYRGPDKISQPIKTARKQHLYFIVNDNTASKKYFFGWMCLDSICRIANLTAFVRLESPDQRMFVVELRKEIPTDQVLKKCEQMLKHLQTKNHLSSTAQIVKCDSRLFTYSSVIDRTTDDDLDKFERLPTDLIGNLYYYIKPFEDLGDVGLLRLQKWFPDADPQSAEDLAAAS